MVFVLYSQIEPKQLDIYGFRTYFTERRYEMIIYTKYSRIKVSVDESGKPKVDVEKRDAEMEIIYPGDAYEGGIMRFPGTGEENLVHGILPVGGEFDIECDDHSRIERLSAWIDPESGFIITTLVGKDLERLVEWLKKDHPLHPYHE